MTEDAPPALEEGALLLGWGTNRGKTRLEMVLQRQAERGCKTVFVFSGQASILLGIVNRAAARKAATAEPGGGVRPSVHVGFLVAQGVGTGGRAGGTSDHLHPPFKRVFTLGPEVVHVGLEVQLEHVVLVDVLGLGGDGE